MSPDTNFQIDLSAEIDPGQTLIVGLSAPGLSGLTAADQLVEQYDGKQIGHISPADLPAITPFQNGVPRHHTRLYNIPEEDFTVLLSELFIPAWAARSFADQLVQWATDVDISDVAILHSLPYEHGPNDHKAFSIATEEYREKRLGDVEIDAMAGGFLDGVAGELVSRSLDTSAPPTGVFVTPGHVPGPDIDGALVFLDALEAVYDLEIDLTELEDLSDTIRTHLATLAERMSDIEESEASRAEREFYADRMYM